MKNTGEIFGALANQGLLEYRFSRTARLTMPVLAIAGSRDYQAAVEPVREFVRRLPRARLIESDGAGHFMYVEQPERFARDVSAFLKRGSDR